MSITFGILTVGFWLLRIPYGIMWALLIALVDAVPVLGTGTVLVPWALVRLFQGDSLQGIGLLCVYGAAALVRTVLEPRLVGHQLGLDPLATLGALYVGYRFWGFFGMIITPLLASAALQVLQKPAQR
jgi:predicted PurR-regulated permease PerM